VRERFQDEARLLTKYLFYKLGIKEDTDFQGHGFENIKPCEGPDKNTLSDRQKKIILVRRRLRVDLVGGSGLPVPKDEEVCGPQVRR